MGMIDKPGKLDGQILTIVNGDLGNADTSYTYFNMLAEDYLYFVLSFTIQATTLTIEASNDGPTVLDASATWTDVTTALTGAANATASGMWIIDTPCAFRRVRIKRLTTNATNALKLFLTRSR
jgi:hypothetical protein